VALNTKIQIQLMIKDWLAQNQNNVSELSDISTH